MAKARYIVGEGIEQYINQLEKLVDTAEPTMKKAIYEATNIVSNAIVSNIKNLPTNNNPKYGVTPLQKQGLIEGFGIAHMENRNGEINTKTGFNGYNKVPYKKQKQGFQANAMIARSIEGGTSWSIRKPFVAPAVNKTKGQANEIMQKVFDEEIKKYID